MQRLKLSQTDYNTFLSKCTPQNSTESNAWRESIKYKEHISADPWIQDKCFYLQCGQHQIHVFFSFKQVWAGKPTRGLDAALADKMFSFYWGGGFPANASQMRGSDKLWHVPKQTHVPHCQPNLFPSQEINAACQMSPTCCQGSEWCFRGFWGGLGVSGWGGKLCRGMSWGCLHFCILIWGGGGGVMVEASLKDRSCRWDKLRQMWSCLGHLLLQTFDLF